MRKVLVRASPLLIGYRATFMKPTNSRKPFPYLGKRHYMIMLGYGPRRVDV